jgi:hypothetical protein
VAESESMAQAGSARKRQSTDGVALAGGGASLAKRTQRRRHLEVMAQAATDERAMHYAVCRSLGHEWQHIGRVSDDVDERGRSFAARGGMVGFRSVCRHCGTERVKWVTRSGVLAPTTYRYPEKYQRRGDERLTQQEWRRTWVVTLIGES